MYPVTRRLIVRQIYNEWNIFILHRPIEIQLIYSSEF